MGKENEVILITYYVSDSLICTLRQCAIYFPKDYDIYLIALNESFYFKIKFGKNRLCDEHDVQCLIDKKRPRSV